jgi:hypothetical protein
VKEEQGSLLPNVCSSDFHRQGVSAQWKLAGSLSLSQSPCVEVPVPRSFQSGGCNYNVLKQTNTHPSGRLAYLFD